MKIATRISLLILAVLMCGVPAAWAQSSGDAAQLQRELERTDELLRKASDLVSAAKNEQAAELLETALNLQEQAKTAFRNGFLGVALTRTSAARNLAQRIVAMLLDPEERADRVQQELERTDDLLARAREALGPAGPDVTRTLLEAAHKQQSQAWELYRAGNFRPALRMSFQARELLSKVRLQNEEFDASRLEELFRQTEELVARAIEAARSSSSRVMQMAERASDLLRRAQEFASNGRYLTVRHHLMQAQRLAQRALRLASGDAGAGDFERLSEQYEAGFDRLSEKLSQATDPAATDLARESQEHYRLAQELYQAGAESEERAFAELSLALRLLNKAKDLLE